MFQTIVVGVDGRPGGRARKLVRSAACPVIVLPRGAHEPEIERPVAAASQAGEA
jgi:hypothetical protein